MLRIDRHIFEDAAAIGEAAEVSVLVTVVVEVGEDAHVDARHVVRQACLAGYVFKSTVATIAVETWSCAVGEEDVVPAVIVIIDRRDTGWTILDDLECL